MPVGDEMNDECHLIYIVAKNLSKRQQNSHFSELSLNVGLIKDINTTTQLSRNLTRMGRKSFGFPDNGFIT